jgi:hypothetical protein
MQLISVTWIMGLVSGDGAIAALHRVRVANH